jgi:hypothetical protein
MVELFHRGQGRVIPRLAKGAAEGSHATHVDHTQD